MKLGLTSYWIPWDNRWPQIFIHPNFLKIGRWSAFVTAAGILLLDCWAYDLKELATIITSESGITLRHDLMHLLYYILSKAIFIMLKFIDRNFIVYESHVIDEFYWKGIHWECNLKQSEDGHWSHHLCHSPAAQFYSKNFHENKNFLVGCIILITYSSCDYCLLDLESVYKDNNTSQGIVRDK